MFGENLQQLSSHRALLQLQDAEIQLLELIKKSINQRIKSDREYANALTVLVSYTNRIETDFDNPLFQVWNGIIKETQSWIDLLRNHVEKLSSKALEKLITVINEKKASRKFYQEERVRLDSDLVKQKDEVTRLKSEYEKCVLKQIQDRAKVEEAIAKGSPVKKVEDARSKLMKNSIKLHKIHNDYVMAIHEATLHQKHYLNTTLPGMLNYQEQLQQTLVEQCKSVLQDYADLTDFATTEHTAIYKSIHDQVESISPMDEYTQFAKFNKSEKLEEIIFDFDKSLLNGYIGTLKPNLLALDDLTMENIQHNFSRISEELSECQQKITNKEASFNQQKDKLVQLQSGTNNRNSIIVQSHAVLDMGRELQEMRCRESILKDMYEVYNQQLIDLGDQEPPPGVDLLESLSPQNYEKADKAVKTNSQILSDLGDAGPIPGENQKGSGNNFHAKINMFVKKFRPPISSTPIPPPPPARDFETSTMVSSDSSQLHHQSSMNSSGDATTLSHLRIGLGLAMDSYQQITFDEAQKVTQQMVPNPLRKVDDEDWYHGVLPREEVQRLLVNDGDYLVRASKNRRTGETQYVLSVFHQDHKHFIIQGQEGNWRFEAESFPSIQLLILNQFNSGVPVTKRSGAILKKPIVRETWELKNDDIILGQKIGNGNFGDVFKGVFKSTNTEVAIKTCRETLSEEAKRKFLQEGRILKQYEHENIVRFIGIAAHRHPVMIVMEYVPGGSLLNFLKKQGSQQSKKQLVRMCEDAAAGMAYLEGRNCIHRDLAARNCLVGKKNVVKISDFGMSREEEEYTVSGGLKQIPIKWTAPEALNYGIYTCACDVWSFGVLMWEVFSFGQSPYPGLTNTQARERVDDGYRMPSPDGTPPALYGLMMACWSQEAKDRPRFEQIHKDLQQIQKSPSLR